MSSADGEDKDDGLVQMILRRTELRPKIFCALTWQEGSDNASRNRI
jgi:hypothetical protein